MFCERLLGIDIDCKLSFENQINYVRSKTRAKIKVLAIIALFLNKTKRKLLMNAFFESQFSCYPLSWMFHSRTLNNKINRLHERCLRIIYNDNTSSFTDLLEIDNSVSVHHRNIQVFATELYKFVNGLSPKLLSDCLKLNSTRNRSTFHSWPVCTVLHGTESLSQLGPNYLSFYTSVNEDSWRWLVSLFGCFIWYFFVNFYTE